ncbi:MAG: tetratricopeptide repeat protein [candidate division Zixibacteria bacterium]|nr:tetratricopeptide repeat protein [candidate division Zixibacteria bacterium]
MAFVGVENRINSGDNEYLLKTANDIAESKIVSVLFNDGGIVNTIEKSYENGEMDTSVISEMVHGVHTERKSYIEMLIEFSGNLPEAMDNALWRDRIGRGFFELGMFPEAEEEFKKAVERNAKYANAYNNLGRTLMNLEKFNAAIGYYEVAVQLQPEYADYYVDLAEAYLKSGRCKDTVKACDIALKINVYYARAYYIRALGIILNSLNREDFELSKNYKENAKKDLNKAVSIDPTLKMGGFERALQLLDQERLREAFENIQVPHISNGFEEYSQKKLATYIKLASSFDSVKEEDIRRYISYLESRISENPHFADLHNELGAAYTVLARLINIRAAEHYRKALEVNPAFKKAQKNLKLTENDERGTELLLRAVLGTRDL